MEEYGRMNKVGVDAPHLCPIDGTTAYIMFLMLLQILKELHKSCQREDGSDDQKKGTQLLEVYAIEIQMYTETKNNKKLKVGSLAAYCFWIVLCCCKQPIRLHAVLHFLHGVASSSLILLSRSCCVCSGMILQILALLCFPSKLILPVFGAYESASYRSTVHSSEL